MRVCSTVFGGVNASSSEISLTLRPLIPPSSLSFWKKPVWTRPPAPYAEAGPLYGLVCPILISTSLAPGSYFFCASVALAAVTAAKPAVR